jgi:hypothetical protein
LCLPYVVCFWKYEDQPIHQYVDRHRGFCNQPSFD